jgi:hypothetical protein
VSFDCGNAKAQIDTGPMIEKMNKEEKATLVMQEERLCFLLESFFHDNMQA